LADQTIQDRLSRNLLENVFGRAADLAALTETLAAGATPIQFVHGVSGVGKSTLLQALGARLAAAGWHVVPLDGGHTEPTPAGVLQALATAVGAPTATLAGLTDALAGAGAPVALLVDGYEALGLVDAWMRRALIPALPADIRLVLATRLPPGPQWTQAAEWRGLVRVHPLGPLDDAAARALLRRLGVAEARLDPILAASGGLPVALTLAAQAADPATPEQSPASPGLPELARRFRDNIGEPHLRQAVEAASVVRRLTRPLLDRLVPGGDGEALMTRLRTLDVCSVEADGLALHDAVREAIAADLQATDPARHRRYRREAWRHLDQDRRAAGRPELWRHTADLLYLIGNPICRDAFFPPGAADLRVEPAEETHRPAIRAIAARHEHAAAAALVDLWLDHAFAAFSVVIDQAGRVEGFTVLADGDDLPEALRAADPVARAWTADLRRRPLGPGETALFLRRWLSADAGEAPAPPQAAGWLDIKRSYLERRPALRRVYLGLERPSPYRRAAETLGFRPLEDGAVALGDGTVHGLLLDMGPESVDGWLKAILAAELGLDGGGVLDHARRGVRLDGDLVPLTRREYDVMARLDAHAGAVVSRDDLLAAIWGEPAPVGSNVVDAVVRELRRKLGERAALIETVRGHGYRLGPSPDGG